MRYKYDKWTLYNVSNDKLPDEIEHNRELQKYKRNFFINLSQTYTNNFYLHCIVSYVEVHYASLHNVILYRYSQMLLVVHAGNIDVHEVQEQDDLELLSAMHHCWLID